MRSLKEPMMSHLAKTKTVVSPCAASQIFPLGAIVAALFLSSGAYAADVASPEAAASKEKSSEEQQVLPEVAVNASKEKAKEDGYQATKTRVGKVLQDPQDVPQAITTVTRSLMTDQQVGSLREALRNVSGLTFNAGEGGRAGDNMMLRGFYTFGDIYLDGIRDTAQYNRETFNLEQVDVLRGSAAMLFGRGQAGGVINQVSKMAKLEDANKVSASLGDYGYQQYTADLNKTLGETVALRVNVMDRTEEATRQNKAAGDRPELNRKGIALSLGMGIGTDNELYLNHIYTQTRDVPDFGIRFANGKPVSQYYGTFWGTNANFDDSDTRVSTAIFTHKFNEKTQWRTQVRQGSYQRAYWVKTPPNGTSPALPAANASVGGNIARTLDYQTFTVQSDFSTELELAGMKHEVLFGVEYLHEDSYRQSLQGLVDANGNPYYRSSAVVQTGNKGLNKFKSDSQAVYIQDSIEFVPDWKLLLGVRRDRMDADYFRTTRTNAATVNPATYDDLNSSLTYSENSYRTGLSWQPTPTAHYYLSYSDSFSPTADLYQLTTTPYPAEKSKTTELGAKWLFFDGDLAFRTALYRADKDWERNTDLESSAAILTRKRRTDGLEFELAGRITSNWEVFGGVAFMDSRILKVANNTDPVSGVVTYADPRFEGERSRNTPPMTANFWTTYSFLGNWRVGGGFEAKGERYGYVPSNAVGPFVNGEFRPNSIPGYTRWDAMVSYEEKRWAVRLNVKNLFNKEYYDALYDNGGLVVPGNRRIAILTTEIKF
ncbi:TonB-dependent receptor [Methylovorus sp. SPW-M1]